MSGTSIIAKISMALNATVTLVLSIKCLFMHKFVLVKTISCKLQKELS